MSTRHAVVRVATHDDETVAAIRAALDAARPIALLHPKLPPEQLEAQRLAVENMSPANDDAIILFTSGSTGRARGVVLSRAAIEAAAEMTWQHIGGAGNAGGNDVWLCTLPLAHAGGLSIIVRCRARRGARLRLAPACTPDVFDDDVTLASLVPAQLADLLSDPTWCPPRSLRAVFLGGAAAPRSLVDRALARGVPVRPTYGMTETFGMVATAHSPGGPLVPLPGVTLRAGTRGTPDLIRIGGAMLATRYLDGQRVEPELTTRDLGFLEDGVVHVVGRVDDMIITGGHNVHPTEIEAVLSATPGVRGAVVFGLPDEHWGQVVAAALVVDARFDEVTALSHWHSSLPAHARPRRVAVVAALPRLPSGKLDRRTIDLAETRPLMYMKRR